MKFSLALLALTAAILGCSAVGVKQVSLSSSVSNVCQPTCYDRLWPVMTGYDRLRPVMISYDWL